MVITNNMRWLYPIYLLQLIEITCPNVRHRNFALIRRSNFHIIPNGRMDRFISYYKTLSEFPSKQTPNLILIDVSFMRYSVENTFVLARYLTSHIIALRCIYKRTTSCTTFDDDHLGVDCHYTLQITHTQTNTQDIYYIVYRTYMSVVAS